MVGHTDEWLSSTLPSIQDVPGEGGLESSHGDVGRYPLVVDVADESEDFPLMKTLEDNADVDDDSQDVAGHKTPAGKKQVHWIYPFMNLWKTYVASGIIALPYAYRQGGWGLTALMLIWNAFLNNMTMRLVFSLKLRLNASSYENIGYLVYGRFGYAITVFSIVSSELGFCAAYTVFIVTTLHEMEDRLSIYLYCLIVFVPIVLLCLIPSLERLSFVAIIGNFAMVSLIVIVVTYGFMNKAGGHKNLCSYDLSQAPFVFGVAIYTFAIQCVCIPFSQNVRNAPKVYPRLLDATAVIAGLQCTLFGFLGYFFFGDDTKQMITGNLPKGVFTDVVKGFLVTVLSATFPLQMYVPAQIVENSWVKEHHRFKFAKRSLTRVFLVILTMGLAIAVPFFADLLSLVGAFSCSLIAFVLPTIFYLKVFKQELNVFSIIMVALLFAVGSIAMVIGVYSDVITLVGKLRDLYF